MDLLARRTRSSAVGLAVGLILAALTPSTAAETPQEAPDARRAELERQVKELRRQTAEHPEQDELWVQRLFFESGLALPPAAADGSYDKTSVKAATAAIYQTVCEEWIRARPGDPAPYLQLARIEESPEARGAYLEQVLRRFPHSSAVLSEAVVQRVTRGDETGALALIESFLEDNPDDRVAWRLLATRPGDQERARRALTEWLARVPGDPGALRLWLEDQSRTVTPDELVRLAGLAVSRMEATAEAYSLCERLETLGNGALLSDAIQCHGRVLDTDLLEEQRQRAVAGYGRAALRLGDWSEVERALAALPPERRPSARLTAALGADADRCEEKVRLLAELLDYREKTMDVPELIARALEPCASQPAARDLYLRLLASARPDEMRGPLQAWQGKIAPDQLEGILLTHLRSHSEDPEAWARVDEIYASGGLTEKRLAHLTTWRGGSLPLPVKQAMDLADLLVTKRRTAEAIRVLEDAAQPESGNWSPYERLMALYLLTERPEQAAEVARRLLDAPEPLRSRGHLSLARLALERQDTATAESHYRTYFEGAAANRSVEEQAISEYLVLLGTADPERPLRFLETLAAASRVERPDDYVADWLDRAGLVESAIAWYRKALVRAPENEHLLQRLADTAEAAGRPDLAEESLRTRLRLDPRDSSRWYGLASFLRRQGAREKAIATLTEGQNALGSKNESLQLLAAEIHRENGDLKSAIRELREVMARSPQNGTAFELLQKSYEELAEQANEAQQP